ncbi:MAG: hypothetical protein AB1489_05770 [Acidobacteriota bacterium]
MWKKFYRGWGRGALALIVALLLCQPFALASDGDKNTKKASDTSKTVDMAELLQRLEQAEAAAARAAASASEANQRAVELSKELEQVRQQLSETERELKSRHSATAVQATASLQQGQDEPPSDEQAESEDEAEPESLATLSERLNEVKDQVDLHDTRLKEYSQTRVETGERFLVRLFGTILFNNYYNSAGTFDAPTGLYLLSNNNPALENGANFGSTIRQTQIGFAFQAPSIKGWQLSGDLQLDFFGGNPPVYNGRAFSPLRLRIARVRLEKDRFAFIFGQDDPIIAPLNPNSLAQVGFPALAESGNLWSWTPQAKVAYRLLQRERERVTIEGAVLAPYNGQTNRDFEFETRPDAGERGRFPAFESRLSYQRGDFVGAPTNSYLIFDPQPLQLGIGVHYARQLVVASRRLNTVVLPNRVVNSTVVAGDYVIPLTNFLTLSGELFWGRSLSGLGGGIVQGLVFPFYGGNPIGIRGQGGWTQLLVRPSRNVAVNFAFGVDDPYNEDLKGTRFELAGGTSRTVNRTASFNILYRLRSNFIVSSEYRYMQTFFTEAPKRHNNHINIGFAYLF